MAGVNNLSPQHILNSALQANREKNQILSHNLACKDIPYYAREEINVIETGMNGIYAGVKTTAVKQIVDDNIVTELRKQNSKIGELDALDKFYKDIERILGSKGAKNSLSHQGGEMADALHSLVTNPSSISHQIDAFHALNEHAEKIRSLSTRIQEIRKNVDSEINQSALKVNNSLQQIADLNKTIFSQSQQGVDTLVSINQRRQALQELSEQIGIRAVSFDSIELTIYTEDSRLLVQDNVFSTLEYSASSYVSPTTPLSPLVIKNLGDDTDITNTITNSSHTGYLKGLMSLRDNILPGLQAQLDEYTKNLKDQFNAIHNLGTALNPPSILTGTIGAPGNPTLTNATLVSGQGTVRIGTIDPSKKNLNGYVDIPLMNGMPLSSIVNLINLSTAGINASISPQGQLVLASTNPSYGVTIGSVGAQTASISAGAIFDATQSYGFSHYFGLNNLFDTPGYLPNSNPTGLSLNIKLRDDICSSNGSYIAYGKLSDQNTPTTPALFNGDLSIMNALSTAFHNKNTLFNATAVSPLQQTSLSDYSDGIIERSIQNIASNKHKLETEQYVYEGLSQQAKKISGVNEEDILNESMNLSLSQTVIVRALSLINKMDQMLFDIK